MTTGPLGLSLQLRHFVCVPVDVSCPAQTHCGSAGTNAGCVTKSPVPGYASRLARPLSAALSASLRA